MSGCDFALFEDRINPVDNDSDRGSTHSLHRLADRGERRGVDGRGGNVVEANNGALLGDADAGFVQGTDRAESAHVVKSEHRAKGALAPEKVLGEFVAQFEAGQRVPGFRHVHDQATVEFEVALLGEVANAAPARRAVGEGFRAANESNLAVTERVKVLQGKVAADFVVYDDGTDGV